MTKNIDTNESRRHFLRTAALTAVAATAAGAGAARLSTGQTVITPLPNTAPVILPEVQTVLTGHEDLAELFSKLAAAQADNIRLKAELDAAQRSLNSWQQTNSGSPSSSRNHIPGIGQSQSGTRRSQRSSCFVRADG
jgi:hypothetical protein